MATNMAWPKDFHRHFVIINVSGFRFLMKKRQILKHPKTRLAQFINNDVTIGRELYCDRNPFVFPFIMDYYRHGVLHMPSQYCWTMVREELIFWGIFLNAMADCCTIPLSDELRSLDKRKKLQRVFGDNAILSTSMDFLVLRRGRYFQLGYRFLYMPWRSASGRVYSIIYTTLAVIYAFFFVFECGIQWRDTSKIDENLAECMGSAGNVTTEQIYRVTHANSTYHRALGRHDWVQVYQLSRPAQIFKYLDGVCLAVFAIDLLLRFVFFPSVSRFFMTPVHIIDASALVINVVSYYFAFFAYSPFWCERNNVPIFFVLELFRIVRLGRLFCLSHKYSWMNVLYLTFSGTIFELLLLLGFLSIGVVLFGLCIYVPELDSESLITDPFRGFWYSIVTITTLGYGDYTPATPGGYGVGAVCCTSGVIFVSLQIPLISSIFGDLYDYADEQEAAQKRVKTKRREAKMMSEAASETTHRSGHVGFAPSKADTKSVKSVRSIMSAKSVKSN